MGVPNLVPIGPQTATCGQYQIAVRFGLAHKKRMKCRKSHFICFHHNLNIIGSYYLNVARLNALYLLCDGNI